MHVISLVTFYFFGLTCFSKSKMAGLRFLLCFVLRYIFSRKWLQPSSPRYSDDHLAELVRGTNDPPGCSLRWQAVRQLDSRLSYSQRSRLLPHSRLALLERNRGSQHVPNARQSLQHRRVALRSQSCRHRLGFVTEQCPNGVLLLLSV